MTASLFLSKAANRYFLQLNNLRNTCVGLKAAFRFIFFCLFLLLNVQGYAQTALISASDGGFENATSTFAANGWTVVNGGGSIWNVGTVAGSQAGTKSAFFGPDNNTYSGTGSATVVHFYRDIAVPAGATGITLSFYLKYPVTDNFSDYFDVYTTTSSYTPTAGIDPYGTAGYTNIYDNTGTQYNSFSLLTFALPNSLAGTTVRLVFSFLNNGKPQRADPALDNISLSYTPCISPTLSYTSTTSCVGGSTGTITATGSTRAAKRAIRFNSLISGFFHNASSRNTTKARYAVLISENKSTDPNSVPPTAVAHPDRL